MIKRIEIFKDGTFSVNNGEPKPYRFGYLDIKEEAVKQGLMNDKYTLQHIMKCSRTRIFCSKAQLEDLHLKHSVALGYIDFVEI